MNYIYKIVCKELNVTNKCYIGSTNNFKKRMALHKHSCNHHIDLPLYEYISLNGGWSNFQCIVLCECHCISSVDLKKLERFYCELYHPQLNVRKSYSTIDEKKSYYQQYTSLYNQLNKSYFKQYYLNNKEKYNKKNTSAM